MSSKIPSELNRWTDWIIGPDRELLTNPKTRTSSILMLLSLVIYTGLFLLFDPSYPTSLLLLLPFLAFIFFVIRVYLRADEFIKNVSKDAAAITFLALLVVGAIASCLPPRFLWFLTAGRLISGALLFYGLSVVIVFKSKM